MYEAAESSTDAPGRCSGELPKASLRPGDNFVVVFRHGESEDNRAGLFSGTRNCGLTGRGREQALALGPRLVGLPLDVAISSDLSRSRETTRLALSSFPSIRFEEEPRLRERDYGALTGRSKAELMEADPEHAVFWRRGHDVPPPGGESIQMVEDRVWPFLDELVARVRRERINVVLSLHGNSMRVTRRYFEGMELAEELTHENPLGCDYALYRVAPGR